MTTDSADLHRAWTALARLADPEIPTVSVVEMGIIEDVRIDGLRVSVTMVPTFSGCPALLVMKESIADALRDEGFDPVVIVSRKPWTSDRLSDSARGKMRSIGLAPPEKHGGDVERELGSPVVCPWCGSTDTGMDSAFGPTLCRSLYYCRSCRQPFEKFKPL